MLECLYCRGDKCTVCSRDLEKLFNKPQVINSRLESIKIFNFDMAAIELLSIIDLLEPELRNHWLHPSSSLARENCIKYLSYYLERKSGIK